MIVYVKDNSGCIISWREALYVGWSQEEQEQAPNTKLSITRSFFELQSPDFAWKFICQNGYSYTKRAKTQKYKKIKV